MTKELLNALGLLSDEAEVAGYIGTGSYALNRVISGDYTKGIPRKAIIEFYGESSSAKTVFVTSICAEAQKLGYHVKFQDVERSLSPGFAEVVGIDPKKLYYTQPETVEAIFEDIEGTIKQIRAKDPTTPIVIAVDSIAVAPIRKELEGEEHGQSETTGMVRAKIIGGCLRRINPLLQKEDVTLIIINQLRSKMAMFGSPDTKAAGGRSLQFYCAVCLETKSSKKDVFFDDNDNPIGIRGKIKNTKNKVSIPFRECDFELVFDKGLTEDYGLVDMLCKDGVIDDKTSKGWCILGEKKFRKKDFLAMYKAGDFPQIENLLKIPELQGS